MSTALCRRIFQLIAVAAINAGLPTSAIAQDYPTRPIRLVVPAVPGGSSDSITRLLARIMQEQNNIQVLVDNRPGASGTIGSAFVARSANDGYTFLLSDGTIALLPMMANNVPYTIDKDLIPLMQVARTHFVFAVNPKLGVTSMKEFVSLAAARPGKMNYSTPGNGSLGHLVGETLKARASIDLLHVPYKGAAPALQAVLAQEVDMTVTSPASMRGFIERGQLQAIAYTGATRAPALPNVPTMTEQGFSDSVLTAWWGVFLPAGVPAPVSDKLTVMIQNALRSPEYAKQMAAMSLEIATDPPKQFSQRMNDENRTWKQLINNAHIRLD